MVQRKIVKKREVFWDAVGMIAVTDNDDSLHDQAIAVRDGQFQEGTKFVTTDDIWVEVGVEKRHNNEFRNQRISDFGKELIRYILNSL